MQKIIFTSVMIILICFTLEVSTRIICRYFLIFDVEMLRYSTLMKNYENHDLLTFEHKKNVQEKLMGVKVQINSIGLRDQDMPMISDTKHIAFLGDSLTFGWGIEKSKIFEEIIEKEIKNSGYDIDIFNYAHCNYNSEQEINFFLKKANFDKVKAVVLFYFINDAELTPAKLAPPLYSKSLFISLAISRYQRLMYSKNYSDYYVDLYKVESLGWVKAKDSIINLKQELLSKEIPLQVFILPELHQLSPYPFSAIHEIITTFFKENKISSHDLTESFKDVSNPQSLWVALDDAHPNELAHKILANNISPEIKKILDKIK